MYVFVDGYKHAIGARTKSLCLHYKNSNAFEHKIILNTKKKEVKSGRSEKATCVADVLSKVVCPRIMPVAIFGLLLYCLWAYLTSDICERSRGIALKIYLCPYSNSNICGGRLLQIMTRLHFAIF